jgi:curved DNA-binding protein CbpA
MGNHSFSLDPRTVLGVGACATLDEIRDAYHSKSKKHHPDLGGDEWAFRMVTRAYEVLKTTAASGSADSLHQSANGWTPPPATENDAVQEPGMGLDGFRTVDVDLIWMRFETEGTAQRLPVGEENEETLSVCVVISWPDAHLVKRAVEQDSAGEILRTLVDVFGRLRGSDQVFAGRSRIEDGQFVGWLSYPNVLAAQDAFLLLRETLQDEGLAVKLRTIDERVPLAWQRAAEEPVMAGAL